MAKFISPFSDKVAMLGKVFLHLNKPTVDAACGKSGGLFILFVHPDKSYSLLSTALCPRRLTSIDCCYHGFLSLWLADTLAKERQHAEIKETICPLWHCMKHSPISLVPEPHLHPDPLLKLHIASANISW